jgi:predicted nucleotidyltransferase
MACPSRVGAKLHHSRSGAGVASAGWGHLSLVVSLETWHTHPMSINTPLTRDSILNYLRANLPRFREDYGVSRVGLFGSAARDTLTAESDIDILVEFEQVSFDRYMDLKFDLEDHFERAVDLVTADTVKARIRPVIERETVYV